MRCLINQYIPAYVYTKFIYMCVPHQILIFYLICKIQISEFMKDCFVPFFVANEDGHTRFLSAKASGKSSFSRYVMIFIFLSGNEIQKKIAPAFQSCNPAAACHELDDKKKRPRKETRQNNGPSKTKTQLMKFRSCHVFA